MRRDRRGGRRLLLALAASAGLHLAVLGVLVTNTKPPPLPPPSRPVEVTLFRPLPAERPLEDPAAPEPPPTASEAAREDRAAANAPVRPRRPILTRPSEVGVLPVAPGAATPPRPTAGVPPPARPAPSPSPPSPRPPSGLGRALQAADCDERGRRLNRPGCDQRLGEAGRAAAPLPPDPNARLQAEAAARTAAIERKEAARLKALPFGLCPTCGGMGGGGPVAPVAPGSPFGPDDGVNRRPFGRIPPAITPIAPSTLRGDDDALRPKPRP